jgi:putative spermidine/putrescine transport system permease protein
VLRVFTAFVIVFLLAPIVVVLAVSFTDLNYLSFPPRGFTLRWFGDVFRRTEFLDSFTVSVLVASVTAFASTIAGGAVAVGLSRHRFIGRDAIAALFLSPLILPTVVVGLSLLQYYSYVGLSISPLALIFGHVIITMPYAIRLLTAGLASTGRDLELAAQGLGATPLRAFLVVTLPLMSTAVIASAFFTFIASFDNVTISVFLSTPTMTTLPVRIFAAVEQFTSPYLAALATLLILWNGVLVMILERLVGVAKLYGVSS